MYGACARVCVYGKFQASASVKLPGEALEDEERSRRDPAHAICHPARYPRNRVRTCDLVSRDSTEFASYDENWRTAHVVS